MNPLVLGYKKGSASAKLLAAALGGGYTYPDGPVAAAEGQAVINWGNGYHTPHWANRAGRWVNRPRAIARSVSKLSTFALLEQAGLGDYIPEYTQDAAEALKWINKGEVVFAREDDEGKAGKGIVVYDKKAGRIAVCGKEEFIAFPRNLQLSDLARYVFFSKQFQSEWELKVHVAFGEAWLWWRVERDPDYYAQSPYIRNYAEGYHFRTCKTDIHPKIKTVCQRAIAAHGLDFGVVDIGLGKKPGEMCIFETNTAPAIDETDAKKYAEMFRRKLNIK